MGFRLFANKNNGLLRKIQTRIERNTEILPIFVVKSIAMTHLKTIQVELQRLSEMAARWESSAEVSTIERELMLARLRDLYEQVRFELPAVSMAAPTPQEPVAPIAVAEEPVLPVIAETAPIEEPIEESAIEESAVEESAVEEETLPILEESMVALDADALMVFEPFAETSEPEAEFEPESTIEPEPIVEAEPAPEDESTPAVEPEPIAEPESEVVETPIPTPTDEPTRPMATQTLFGEEEQVARHRHKQRVIMSLYDEPQPADRQPKPTPTAVPQPRAEEIVPAESELVAVACEPEVIEVAEAELEAPFETPMEMPAQQPLAQSEPAPIVADSEAAPRVLGETIPPVQTLADTIVPPVDVATELRHREPITDLRRAVGINDKFLLIRDLFNGNGSLYEITIRRLNEFDNFDDCMIYIAEHFAWNPNSDGAKLLMELLERKFDQQ